MLNKILGTTGTRILNAGLTFLILWMTTNYLGKEGVGTISLIILDISIILLVTDFIGGSALVYFSSRASVKQLIMISYIWALIILIAFVMFYFALEFTNIETKAFIAKQYEIHILLLALLNSASLMNFNILVGLEKIKQYNIAFSIQVVSLTITLSVLLFIIEVQEVISYVIALYISYFLSYVYGLFHLFKHLAKNKNRESERPAQLIKKMLAYGSMGQFANILTLANKRFSFVIINKFTGIGQLGVYSASAQITEGLRIIGQSISIVQFARISNTRDLGYAKDITLKLLKFAVSLTILALLILLLIPSDVFAWIFGDDFKGIKPVIITLSIGVIAMSATMIFAHFFSGIGKPKYNLFSSAAGFIATIAGTIILIPSYGILGAGYSISISYSIICIYQLIVFKKITNGRFSELLPNKSDIKYLKNEFLLKKKTRK